MNSIKIPFENSIKIPDNGIEFSFIPLKFHQFLIFLQVVEFFTFFPVKKPEIKDKRGLLTGTSWLKKQKFQQKNIKFSDSTGLHFTI